MCRKTFVFPEVNGQTGITAIFSAIEFRIAISGIQTPKRRGVASAVHETLSSVALFGFFHARWRLVTASPVLGLFL
jgi:hypothetical protein